MSEARASMTIQQLASASERLALRERGWSRVDWLALVEAAYDRVSARPFVALPTRRRVVRSGKDREVMIVDPVDRLIEEALRPLLDRAVEPLLSDSVHGYRRGRSTLTAAAETVRLLSSGAVHLAFADIESFFPSICRERLAAMLAKTVPPRVAEIASSLLAAPVRGAAAAPAPTGLPLGRSISPVLSNLYLTSVDRSMRSEERGYLRYADDILLAERSSAALDQSLASLREALATLGLRLNESKLRRLVYTGEAVPYLGHAVDAGSVFQRVSPERLSVLEARARERAATPTEIETVPGAPRCQTLYVTQPGAYLRMDQGRVQIRVGPELVREIPLHRVDRVLVLAGVTVTSGFLSACIGNGVPVLFFVGRGKAYGSLVASNAPNPVRLRAQYDLHADLPRRLGLAREVIEAKLRAILLVMRRRKRCAGPRREVRALLRSVDSAETPDTLMGIEGAGTRIHYRTLAGWIRGRGFAFPERTRRPPRDCFNSLLSFSYSLLFSEIQTLLLAHGLDPHPGLVHNLRRDHPALVSDLMEPYRVLLADLFVLSLVNRRRVKESGFMTGDGGAVYMDRDTRHVFLDAWEQLMRGPPPGVRTGIACRSLLEAAVRAFLAVVMGETDHLVLPLGHERGTTVPAGEGASPP